MTGLESDVVALYILVAAFAILGWWALEWAGHGKAALLAHGASHLAAESATFFALLLGGVLLLVGGPYPGVVVPVALGMLLYATVNALGRVGMESGRLAGVMVVEALATLAVIVFLASGY